MLEISANLCGEEQGTAYEDLHPGAHPRRTPRCRVLALEHNMELLLPRLANGQAVSAALPEACFVLLGRPVGSSVTKLKRINRPTAFLLELCDGAQPMAGVFDEVARSLGLSGSSRGTFAGEARGLLSDLIAAGLVCLSPPPD